MMTHSARLPLVCSLFLTLHALGFGQYPGAEAPPEEMRPGHESMNVKDANAWLSILASDDFAGRDTGTAGYMKAAEFVAARFKEFGLEPVGDDGTYFQHVKFVRTRASPQECRVTVVGSDVTLGNDEGLRFEFGNGEITGEVAFVAARGRDAKLENPEALKGKIVILSLTQGFSSEVRKQIEGAGPLLILDQGRGRRVTATEWSEIRLAYDLDLSKWRGSLTTEACRKLAETLQVDAKFIDGRAATDGPLVHVVPERQITVKSKVDVEEVLVPNVVGVVRGSDPQLRDEVVICGSHLDHVGTDDKGVIYNGADDDGSGSTALLLVSRAFAKNPVKPKRTTVFIALCGEEKGLLGARYYVNHPIFPIEKTVCELQMDMVGRNEESKTDKPEDNVDTLHLVGSTRLSTELHETVLALNETHVKFRFEYDEEDVYTRSDHYMFAEKGIPIAFFFSGFHPDYHKPTDDVEKINFEKIVSTARLVYLTAFSVGDQAKRLKVDKGPFKTAE